MVGEVLSLMKELAQRGLTMVVVTHEIGFAREVASRVLFMDKGKIVEEGPPDRVIDRPANPRLQEFFPRCSDTGSPGKIREETHTRRILVSGTDCRKSGFFIFSYPGFPLSCPV